MAAFAIGEGWQIHDAVGRRKYLSADERTRFLRAADFLSPRRRALCHVMAYAGCRTPRRLRPPSISTRSVLRNASSPVGCGEGLIAPQPKHSREPGQYLVER